MPLAPIRVTSVLSLRMSSAVPSSVSNAVPEKPMSEFQLFKYIYDLYIFGHRATRLCSHSDGTYTVKYGLAEEIFPKFFTIVDNVLRKPFFAPYISTELVDALMNLHCLYDEALIVHEEYSSNPPTTKWASNYLATTETFKNIQASLTPYTNWDDVKKEEIELCQLSKALYYHINNNRAKRQEEYNIATRESERPALLQAICLKLNKPYSDDLYSEYVKWYTLKKAEMDASLDELGDGSAYFDIWGKLGKGSRYNMMVHFVENRNYN
jgi:hypothetical protein